MAVYLSAISADDDAREHSASEYRVTGKCYDMGQSRVRFRNVDYVPLDVIGDALEAIPLDQFVTTYEAVRSAVRDQKKKA